MKLYHIVVFVLLISMLLLGIFQGDFHETWRNGATL